MCGFLGGKGKGGAREEGGVTTNAVGGDIAASKEDIILLRLLVKIVKMCVRFLSGVGRRSGQVNEGDGARSRRARADLRFADCSCWLAFALLSFQWSFMDIL